MDSNNEHSGPTRYHGLGIGHEVVTGPVHHIRIERDTRNGRTFKLVDERQVETTTDEDIIVIPQFLASMSAAFERAQGVIGYAGSETSSAAIQARERNLPAVVNCDTEITNVMEGTSVTLDADGGLVIIEGQSR